MTTTGNKHNTTTKTTMPINSLQGFSGELDEELSETELREISGGYSPIQKFEKISQAIDLKASGFNINLDKYVDYILSADDNYVPLDYSH